MPTPITSGILLALAAGAAQAQTLVPVLQELPDGRTVERMAPLYTLTSEYCGGRYAQRDTIVFDSTLTYCCSRSALACAHTLDAFSFAPGPWASASTRVASSWTFSLWMSHWDGAMSPSFNMRFRFYAGSAFASTVGADMIPNSATVIADLTYHFAAGAFEQRPDPGYLNLYYMPDNRLDTTPGAEQLKFTGDAFLIEASVEDPDHPGRLAWYPSAGATNLDPLKNLYVPPGENSDNPTQLLGILFYYAQYVGRPRDIGYGRDMNGDGVFTYAPVVTGGGFTTPTDDRDYRNSGNRHYAMQIFGNICPCRADFDASGGTPDVSDIEAYFSSWLAGAPEADVDCSSGTPDTTDIELFFAQWLAGGCA